MAETIAVDFGGPLVDAMNKLAQIGATNGPPKAAGDKTTDTKGAPAASEKGLGEIASFSEKLVKGQEGQKSYMGRLGKVLGIQVGLSSILKQSQIFTGTIGSIFQIFGALVDVILAPFLPIIVPGIRMLASFVPMIYAITSKVGNWIQENLTVEKIDGIIDAAGGRIIDFFLGWLPDAWKNKLKEWFQGINWGTVLKSMAFGAVMLLFARKLGIMKALAPLARLLGRIPILGPILKNIVGLFKGLGAAIARAIIPGFGKVMGKNVDATGKAMAKEGAKKGGFFSKFKPSNVVSKVKGAGLKGLAKGALKKAVPGLSSAFLMYEGVKGAIDVYKSNRSAGGSFWKSLGKASAVGATGVAAAGRSFAPGMGLVAPIAGSAAIGAMTNKLSVQVNVDGKEGAEQQIDEHEENKERSEYAEGYGATVVVTNQGTS